jgi:GNAT superfamily N-acetyltransferase
MFKAKYTADRSKLWVLVDAVGNVIGSIGALALEGSSAMELVRMYVDGRYRRLGYGQRLFSKLLEHALDHDAKELHLSTPSVNAGPLQFYRAMGFEVSQTFEVSEPSWGNQTIEITELRRAVKQS